MQKTKPEIEMANKKILIISKEIYKGISLFETPHGTIAICLGTQTIEVANAERAKLVIDEWMSIKLN